MLNIDNNYLCYQYGVTYVNPRVHFRNFNKQHLILAKVVVNIYWQSKCQISIKSIYANNR